MKLKSANRLGIINNGSWKGKVCIVLCECDYITSDNLKWFKILIDNNILSMSNNNINFL